MDIKELEQKLLSLNNDIEDIFKEIGYKENHKLDNVNFNKESLNEGLLYYEYISLFTHLDFINSLLGYLKKPIIQEGVIETNGTKGYKLNDIKLKRKDIIEIIAFDKIDKVYYWRPIIVKDHSINLEGKQARIRG